MKGAPDIKDRIERVQILGVPVDYVDMRTALDFVDSAIRNNKPRQYIIAITPEKVVRLQHENHLKKTFEDAALLIPDGVGIVMAIRWLFGFPATRVPGAELMPNICREAAKKGYKIFLYGSKEEVNKAAAEKLRNTYPGIQIVGRSNGYVKEDQMPVLIKEINKSRADILFVALGSPKQEYWIKTWLPQLDVRICQGVGGTLDTIVGVVKRAPPIVQTLNLEWAYRLVREPKKNSKVWLYPPVSILLDRKACIWSPASIRRYFK